MMLHVFINHATAIYREQNYLTQAYTEQDEDILMIQVHCNLAAHVGQVHVNLT